MGVTVTPVLASDPIELCQGCGVVNATDRIETCPDVNDVPPADLFLCGSCYGELKKVTCAGVVKPEQVGGGKVGSKHPAQARRAAANVKTGTQHARLLTMLATYRCQIGDEVWVGVTCRGAADLFEADGVDISPNQVATRMGELKDMGLVEPLLDDGQPVLRATTPGNEGQVWVCTEAGRLEAARLNR